MDLNDDILMAYADGELPAGEAVRVAAAIAGDPALAARVERFRMVRRALKSAYDSVLEEPVPDRLRALLHDVDIAAAPKRPLWRRIGVGLTAALLAACLAGAVLVGRSLTSAPLFTNANGALLPNVGLTRALDSQLAADAGAIRIRTSFRAQNGALCRVFSGAGARAVLGVACRDAGAWTIRVAADASREGEAAIANTVSSMIDGAPLSAAQEEAARSRGWAS